MKSLYFSDDFGLRDLNDMSELGWSDQEIFDVINHAAFMLQNGKIISAYLE